MSCGWYSRGFDQGCHWQVNQRNLTKLEKTKRFRRSANSKDEAEDQMSKEEEEGGFRKAEVEKKKTFSILRSKLSPTLSARRSWKESIK